jgi:hypothetical protein
MVLRAISELSKAGTITRVDGGDESADRLAAALIHRKHLEAIASRPFTESEFDSFVRLNPKELEQRYWGSDVAAAEFRARYDAACRQFGFRKPAKPSEMQATAAVADLGQWGSLTAKTYNSTPIADVKRLYKSDLSFRAAVDKLIKNGEI